MDASASAHKRRRGTLLTGAVIAVLVAAVFLLDAQRRGTIHTLEQLSASVTQGGEGRAALTPEEIRGREEAKRVIGILRGLMQLPDDVEPTVATIVDVEKLRKQNAFYARAENGDYLILTRDRAIILRIEGEKGTIIDMVPIQTAPPTATPVPAAAAGH